MSIGNFFGKLGRVFTSPAMHGVEKVGVAVLGAYAPGLGAVAELIANAVYNVESQAAPATPGPDKKAAVQAIVDLSAPVTLAVLSNVTGKPVTNPAALAPAIDTLIDDMVALFNLLGVFAGHTPASAVSVPLLVPVPVVVVPLA